MRIDYQNKKINERLRRSTAMLLVIAMVCGCLPGGLWPADAVAAESLAEEIPDYRELAVKQTFDLANGPAAISESGNYRVEQSGASTANTITISANVDAVVVLAGVNISCTTTNPVTLGAGAEVTLVLASGSENKLITSNNHAGIHVPQTAALTIATEDAALAAAQWGSLTINSASRGAAIGGAGGANGGTGAVGGAGQTSGAITINSGIVTATGNIGGGNGGTGGNGTAGSSMGSAESAIGKSGGNGTQGRNGGAGGSSIGKITINGGLVKVTGNIGGGNGANGGTGGAGGGSGPAGREEATGGSGGAAGAAGVGGSNSGGIELTGGEVTASGNIGGGNGGNGGAGGAGGAGGTGNSTKAGWQYSFGGHGKIGTNGAVGGTGGSGGTILVDGAQIAVTGNLGGGTGGSGGNGGAGGVGGRSAKSPGTNGSGNGGRGGAGGTGGVGGTGGALVSLTIQSGSVTVTGNIGGGNAGRGGNGGKGGNGGGTGGGTNAARGGNGANGGRGGSGGAGGVGGAVSILDGSVTTTTALDGGTGGTGGTGGALGSGGSGYNSNYNGASGNAGGAGATIAARGSAGTLDISGGVVSVGTFMKKNGNTTTGAITSGNVKCNANTTYFTRPTNGADYGRSSLYLRRVQLVDRNDLRVVDTHFTVELVGSNEEPYTYTAYAADGLAYIWLPLGTHTIKGENATRGRGSLEFTMTTADNNLISIPLGQIEVNLSRTEGKSYSTVDLEIESFNGDEGDEAAILETWWFRTAVADTGAVTAENFLSVYEKIDKEHRGSSEAEGDGTPPTLVSRTDQLVCHKLTAEQNGRYWVMTDFIDGDGLPAAQVASIVIDNIYTPYPIGVRGRIVETGSYLYGSTDYYEPTFADCGIPFDLDDRRVITAASCGYDEVELTMKRQYEGHWVARLKNGDSLPRRLTLDSAFMTNPYCDDDDPQTYTILYDYPEENDGVSWRSLTLKYVNQAGKPVEINGKSESTIQIPVEENGDCTRFLALGGRFTPPGGGGMVASGFLPQEEFDGAYVVPCPDFSLFNPVITKGVQYMYIVYEEGRNLVNELYMTKDGAIRFDSGADSLPYEQEYRKGFRQIPGYVEVGYQVNGLTEVDGKDYLQFDFDAAAAKLGPEESQHGHIQVQIPAERFITGRPAEVRFFYAQEENGSGIPKDDSVRIDVQWIGTGTDDTRQRLDSETRILRKGGAITLHNDRIKGDPDHTLPVVGEQTARWIFADPGRHSLTWKPGDDPTVTFHYAYATDGITPDQDQYVEEIHQLENGQILFREKHQMLIGSAYDRAPNPVLADENGEPRYVLYGVKIDEAAVQEGVRRGVIPQTYQAVHTVTYLYRTPALLAVTWQGITQLGTIAPFAEALIIGYAGEDLTIQAKEMAGKEYADWILTEALLNGVALELSASAADTGLVVAKDETQTLVFNYQEASQAAQSALVTVKGLSREAGEAEAWTEYSYSFDLRQQNEPYPLVPGALSGKILVKALVNGVERKLRPAEAGGDDYLAIYAGPAGDGGDVIDGEIQVEFIYEPNVTEVTIYLREYAGDENRGQELSGPLISSFTVPGVAKGSKLHYQAPTWPGYLLIDETKINEQEASEQEKRPPALTRVIDVVDEENNSLTFWYEKAAGGIVFVCYDDDPDLSDPQTGLYHEIARPFYPVEYKEDFRFQEKAPDLAEYQLQKGFPELVELTWEQLQALKPQSGSGENSILIYVPYTKNREEVRLRAVNANDGRQIGEAILSLGERRVGEYLDYSAYLSELSRQIPAKYNLLATDRTAHRVISRADEDWYEGANDIVVLYLPDPVDTVTIQYVDSLTDEVLERIVIPVGEGVVVDMSDEKYEPQWPGFRVLRDQSTMWAKAGSEENSTITFVLEDYRWIVSVAIYKKDAEDLAVPERVYEYGRFVPAVNSRYEVFPPLVPGYVCTDYVAGASGEEELGSRDRVTFPITGDTTVRLYYTEIGAATGPEYADLEVTGKGYGRPQGADGETLYHYTLRVEKGAMVTLTEEDAFDMLPAWHLLSGQNEIEVSFGASEERKTVDFLYQYNLETITIRTYAYDPAKPDGRGQPLLTDIEIGGVRKDIGEFSYEAPLIPGWQLVNPRGGAYLGSQRQTIDFTILPYPNYLEFYYVQAEGNITIYHRDQEQNKTIAVTYAQVESGVTSQPFDPLSDDKLREYGLEYYTADEDPRNYGKTVTWDPQSTEAGLTPPFTLEFTYHKEKQPVILEAWDTVTGKVIEHNGQALMVNIPARRVAEYLDYVADWQADAPAGTTAGQRSWVQELTDQVKAVNSGYRLATAGSTLVYVNPEAPTRVQVWFNPPASGVIPVEVYAVTGWRNAETQEGPVLAEVPLRTYALPAAPGETVTISQANGQIPQIPGYVFLEKYSQLSATEGREKPDGRPGERETILILMVDMRPEVTVNLHKLDQEDTLVESTVYKTEAGQPYLVFVPYLPDYVLDFYKLSVTGENGVGQTSEHSGDQVRSVTVAADETPAVVDLYYETIDNELESRHTTVIIEGLTGQTVHYRYEKRILRSDLPYTLREGEDVFRIPGHRLTAAQNMLVTETDAIKTLHYENLETTVTIHMVDADDRKQAVAPSYTMAAVAGESFSCNAPHVPGHGLSSDITVELAEVAADGSSAATFEYRPITGPVRMVLKEENTEGRIIGLYEVAEPQPGTAWYDVPDLTGDYYTALVEDGKVSITYEDVPVSIEVYYRKDTVNIALKAVDQAGQAILTAVPEQRTKLRRGEAVVIEAPQAQNADGEYYLLVSEPTQSFVAQNGLTATFVYRALDATEVLISAISEEDDLLKSYVERGEVNKLRMVEAPTILGWQTEETTKNIRFGQTKSVQFTYSEDVVDVTIHTQDLRGEVIAPPEAVPVPRGSSYRARAPHVGGYVVSGQAAQTFSDLSRNEEVTFTYKTLEEAMDEKYLYVIVEGLTDQSVHYRYVKQIDREELPYTLKTGEDIFTVPGHRLAADQDLVVTEKDVRKTVRYTTLETTVTVHMEDVDRPGQAAAPSFTMSAIAGTLFSCNAPHVADYVLSSKVTESVLAAEDGSSAVTFYYKRISGPVRMVLKEDDADGRIIGLYEVPEPKKGTFAYPVPDLSKDYYTAKAENGTVFITYENVPVSVEVYYTKELVDVALVAVDLAERAVLTAQPARKTGLRRGETATVEAPQAKTAAGESYLLVSEPTQTVAVDTGVSATFAYRALTANEILVNAVSDKGHLLRSYVERGETGEERTIYPPVIQGWKSVESSQTAIFGQKSSVTFVYTEDVVTVRIQALDEKHQPITAAEVVTVARGANYTARAPHVTGYVISGESTKTFSALATDETAAFYYRPLEENTDHDYLEVTLTGLTQDTVHYRYVKRIAKAELPYALTAGEEVFHIPGYKLAAGQDLTITAGEVEKRFQYTALDTGVTIRMVDEKQPEQTVAASFQVNAVAGEAFSYNAPHVPGYMLAPEEQALKYLPQVAEQGDVLTFFYRAVTSDVVLVAKEDNTDGRIILLREVADPQPGRHSYPVPDLTADYYTYLGDEEQIAITYEAGAPVMVELYYRKELTALTLIARDQAERESLTAIPGTQPGLRKGEIVTAIAPQAQNATGEPYLLVGGPTQIVRALPGAQAVFTYRALNNDEVLVNAVTADGRLLRSFVERGSAGTQRSVPPPVVLGWKTGERAKVITFGEAQRISFVYTEDVVTVTIKAEDSYGQPLLKEENVAVPRGGDYTARAPHVAGFVIEGKSSKTFTTLVQDREAVFTYRPVGDVPGSHLLAITVEGRVAGADPGAAPLYTTTKLVEKAAYEPFGTILPEQTVLLTYGQEVLNLRPSWELIKQDGQYGRWEELAGSDADVYTLSVSGEERAVTEIFYYEDNLYTVTVQMLLFGSESLTEVMPAIKIPGVEGGIAFAYTAPIIPGYQLVSDSGQNLELGFAEHLDLVGPKTNVLRFYYVKASGNQTVLLRDAETDQLIGVEYRELKTNVPQLITPPDLPYYTTTDKSVSVAWNGVGEPADLEFTYTRHRQDVVLTAFALDGTPIQDENGSITYTMPQQQRVMEFYDYNDPDGGIGLLLHEVQTRAEASYLPVIPGNTRVLVEPSRPEIQVFFRLPQKGAIPTEVWLDPGPTASGENPEGRDLVFLYSYMVPAATGETRELNEDQLPDLTALGYRVNPQRSHLKAKEGLWQRDEWQTAQTQEDSGVQDRFTIIVDDQRLSVTVVFEVADGTAPAPITYKVVSGADIEVPVTYLPGFALETYQIAGEPEQDGRRTPAVELKQVTKDAQITFRYQPISWGGSGDGDGEPPVYSNVTVRLIDEAAGAELRSPQVYQAEPGTIFTCEAPVVADYILLGVQSEDGTIAPTGIGKVDPVAEEEGVSQITFVYRAIDYDQKNEITIRAVERSANQRYDEALIRVFREPLQRESEGIYSLTVPDLDKDFFRFLSVAGAQIIASGNEIADGELAPGDPGAGEPGGNEMPDGDPEPGDPALKDEDLDGSQSGEGETAEDSRNPAEAEDAERNDGELVIGDNDPAAGNSDAQASSEPEPGDQMAAANENWRNGRKPTLGSSVGTALLSLTEPLARQARDPLGAGLYYDLTTGKILLVGAYWPEEIVVYYEKELAVVEVAARIDHEEGATLGVSQIITDVRKGEVLSLVAPQHAGYTIIGSRLKSFIPELDRERVTFCYRQNAVQSGVLTVIVKSGRAVLAGAQVSLTPAPSELTGGKLTDSQGQAHFTGVYDGAAYIVQVSLAGYITKSETVIIEGGETTHTVSLSRSGSGGGTGGSGGGAGGSTGGDGNAGGDGGAGDSTGGDRAEDGCESAAPLFPGQARELLELLRAALPTAYLSGYPDGTIRPDAAITRAEAAQVFYQLIAPHLDQPFTIAGQPVIWSDVSYHDVSEDQWYYGAVQTLSAYGILNGYSAGAASGERSFRPAEPISRAEFTVLVSRLSTLLSGSHSFPDAKGHWAEDFIANASLRRYISGYPARSAAEGITFRPEASITRGEAAAIVNRLLERQTDAEGNRLLAAEAGGALIFTDLRINHWAYRDIWEAARARGQNGE